MLATCVADAQATWSLLMMACRVFRILKYVWYHFVTKVSTITNLSIPNI